MRVGRWTGCRHTRQQQVGAKSCKNEHCMLMWQSARVQSAAYRCGWIVLVSHMLRAGWGVVIDVVLHAPLGRGYQYSAICPAVCRAICPCTAISHRSNHRAADATATAAGGAAGDAAMVRDELLMQYQLRPPASTPNAVWLSAVHFCLQVIVASPACGCCCCCCCCRWWRDKLGCVLAALPAEPSPQHFKHYPLYVLSFSSSSVKLLLLVAAAAAAGGGETGWDVLSLHYQLGPPLSTPNTVQLSAKRFCLQVFASAAFVCGCCCCRWW
jgi:hypothetical protein